jgi:hypothetical protein
MTIIEAKLPLQEEKKERQIWTESKTTRSDLTYFSNLI